ncbi:MAG TPA: hypothetical protein VMW75_25920, partial [Thermoanaerobaculia bacterium]|nr:hypothetical protein [Thermoanaerobaculia bacterium]
VAARSLADRIGALRQATSQGSRFVCDGIAMLRDIWLHPTINEIGKEEVLWAVEGKLGLSFATIDEACSSSTFQQLIHERVRVQRAIGIQGLFWSLLIDRLKEGVTFTSCKRCGRIIRRNKGKTYCGKVDDLECFRKRRAADRLRERALA